MADVSTQFSIRDMMTSKLNKIDAAARAMDQTLDNVGDTTEKVEDRTSKSTRAMKIAWQMMAETGMSKSEALSAAWDQVGRKVKDSGDKVDQFNKKQRQAATGALDVKNAWSQVSGYVKSAMAAVSAKKVIDLADDMTNIRARLNLMNDGLQTTEELQDMIMKSANRSRASYLSTADAVAKMGIMAKDAFSSNQELIDFFELINKQFTISGAGAGQIDAAMLQLTQAMSSGVLRGEELNSVFDNASTIIQTIADYLDVPIGKIREMAAEGKITATIVKNAMLASADKINAEFESMPMTFAQIGEKIKNNLLETFEPVIQTIGEGAQWIADNWSAIEPVLVGVAAAAAALLAISAKQAIVTAVNTSGTVAYNIALMAKAAAMGLTALMTNNAALAQDALNVAMSASPIGWIVLLIGVLVMAVYKWIKAVGGLKVAWLIVCDAFLTHWDLLKVGFMIGVYWIMDMWNKLQLAFYTAGVNIQNFMGDMKDGVLMILQNMVNGAIDIINDFINTLNKIPGVNIGLIDQVTFGTTAQLENEAAKQARAADLAAYQDQINSKLAERDAALDAMASEVRASKAQREAEIAAAKAEAAAAGAEGEKDWKSYLDGEGFGGDVDNVGHVGSVGEIEEDVNIAEEDLKFLRDVAEMRYVQNFVTLTPTVAIDAQVSERADYEELARRIERELEDEFVAAAEGVYA